MTSSVCAGLLSCREMFEGNARCAHLHIFTQRGLFHLCGDTSKPLGAPMKSLLFYFRPFVVIIAILFGSAILAPPTDAQASGVVAPAAAAATTSTAGGWIIGGLFFSVASIITCAMIVGAQEGREMTLEEALLSGAIPMGCLLREQLASQ